MYSCSAAKIPGIALYKAASVRYSQPWSSEEALATKSMQKTFHSYETEVRGIIINSCVHLVRDIHFRAQNKDGSSGQMADQ